MKRKKTEKLGLTIGNNPVSSMPKPTIQNATLAISFIDNTDVNIDNKNHDMMKHSEVRPADLHSFFKQNKNDEYKNVYDSISINEDGDKSLKNNTNANDENTRIIDKFQYSILDKYTHYNVFNHTSDDSDSVNRYPIIDKLIRMNNRHKYTNKETNSVQYNDNSNSNDNKNMNSDQDTTYKRISIDIFKLANDIN